MLILNSGGTFNKRYNPLNGELEIPFDNYAVDKILESVNFKYALSGVIYKDSLYMNSDDRKMLASIIGDSMEETFIIIHGTDTMNLSAEFLSEIFDNKKIILTGSMKPFEIDNIEATLNLAMSIGFAQASVEKGVFICMNGYVKKWNEMTKNRELGVFEIVK